MVDVVVVGAGPVGLTAALLLADRGADVCVLERRPEPYPLPRAVHLDDEVFRVLQAAGVADALAAASRPLAGLRLVDRHLRTLAEFPRDPAVRPHGWPQGSLFHQPDLEALLREAVERHPRVELRTGVEVVGLVQDDAGVDVGLREGDPVRGGSVRAGFVLGCDGAQSTVRTLIGATMRDLGPADRWLVLDLRADPPAPVWPGVHQVSDRQRAATFMPVTKDRYRCEVRMRPGERAAELTAPGRLADLIGPFGLGDVEVERAVEYVFRAQVADRWRNRRVLLAGDAAHLTPPFIGQGLGLGLRDVHQLAWKLSAVLDGTAGPELLDTHQAEREPHARALIRVSLLLGALMTRGGALGAATRRGLLAVARRLPAAAALATRSSTPRLRPGAAVARDRLAGTLVPQPEVEVDGRRVRFDDVLGRDGAELQRTTDGALVVRRPDGSAVVVRDPGGALVRWLRAGRAGGVVVRPDLVVRRVVRP